MASVKEVCGALSPIQTSIALRKQFDDVLSDLALLKASIHGVAAKLDADATVTDTNYAATWGNTVLVLKTTA